jgi:Flp pilus assembly protein TadG
MIRPKPRGASAPRPSRPGRFFFQGKRSGAAAVEFAFIAPVILFMIAGALEFSRAIMVKEILHDAARKACRTGIRTDRSNTDVTNDVTNILNDNNIPLQQATTTILVNGAVADVSSAKRNDQISVKVSVPFSQVYWTTTIFLSGATVESETVFMWKQG